MRIEELRSALTARPFKPVRLYLTDGGTLDVTHPDLCLLMRRTAIIGFPAAPNSEEGDRYAAVDLAHVSRFETSGQPNLTEAKGEE